MADLPPIKRPNGKLYRPRKMVACEVTSDDEVVGVIVLGTHDPGPAQPLAAEFVRRYVDSGCTAVDPLAVWWRQGYDNGRLGWVTDEERGRAGVWFREIVEVTSA